MDSLASGLLQLFKGCGKTTFGARVEKFREAFPRQEDNFDVCRALVVLLGDRFNHESCKRVSRGSVQKQPPAQAMSTLISNVDNRNFDTGILSPGGRLHALYLLQYLYQDGILAQNPFLPFFVEVIDGLPIMTSARTVQMERGTNLHGKELNYWDKVPLLAQIESDFLLQLLMKDRKRADELTPIDVITTFQPRGSIKQRSAPIRRLCQDRHRALSQQAPLASLGIRRVLRARIPDCVRTEDPVEPVEFEEKDELIPASFEPEFVRPPPAILPVDPEEIQWLNIEEPVELLDDFAPVPPKTLASTSDAGSSKTVVSDLLNRASIAPLTLEQEDRFRMELSYDTAPERLKEAGFTPEKLTDLLKFNAKAATHVLLALKDTPSINEYYKELVQMDMTVHPLGLHSMEVVTALTSEVRVPSEFVHRYVTNCVRSCEAIQDPFFQTRLVRLVCALVENLIRNKVVNIKELFVEIQTFCILFSRVKEVTNLFRMIRKIKGLPDR